MDGTDGRGVGRSQRRRTSGDAFQRRPDRPRHQQRLLKLSFVGPWQQPLPGLFHVSGPGPVAADRLRHWLVRGCRGLPPVRQGFVAALIRPDEAATIAVNTRWEHSAFFALDGDRMLVGIHPRDVISALPMPPALNLAKLADLVALHDPPTSTPYVGVGRIPLGHALHLAADGRQRVERWFQPSTEEDHSIRPKDAADLVRESVLGAVAASLPATGDVSATLSGGLDSTMVAGAAANLLAPEGRRVHAMTHVPLPGTPDPSATWEASDGPYAEAMADATPGITWSGLCNTARTLPLDADSWMIERTWQPPFNPINQVWFNDAIRQAEDRGDTVLLTGAAGNATFSRDRDGIVPTLLARRQWGAVVRQVGARHRAGLSHTGALRSVAAEALPRLAARRRARRTPPSGDRLGAFDLPLRREAVSEAAYAGLPQLDGTYSMDRDRWVEFALSDFSRIGMVQNFSPTVWWSDPLSDAELIALALRLPEEAWIANGRDRGLARDAGIGIVPERIRLRSTRGSQGADAGSWVEGREDSYRALLEEFRASPSVPEFVDLARLEAAIGPAMTAPATAATWQNVFGRAFSLGQFALWYEREVLRPSRA